MLTKSELLSLHLRKSPNLDWLENNLLFLTVHGSRAYNTAIPTSDYDYKGIAYPPISYFLGFRYFFEQTQLKDKDVKEDDVDDETGAPDSVIYNISKFFNLAATNGNPNFIETLHTDPQFHILVHPAFQPVLDNKQLFLTKKLRHSMGGYAWGNLQRLKRHRSWLLSPVKEPPTRKEMGLPEIPIIGEDNLKAAMAAVNKQLDKFNFNFLHNLTKDERYAIKQSMEEMLMDCQLHVADKFRMCAEKVGFDDNLIEILLKERAYNSKLEEFKKYQHWLKHRNAKRYADEVKYGYDLKFAMHVIRLYITAIHLMKTGEFIVFHKENKLLMEYRAGAFSYDQFIEQSDALDVELKKAYDESKLPHGPDLDLLEPIYHEILDRVLFENKRASTSSILIS